MCNDMILHMSHMRILKQNCATINPTNRAENTYVADTGRPLGEVIEGPSDVEQSHVESVEQRQVLLENKHNQQQRPSLRL